mmetsp:Transcript_85296/g.246590  ORF Transcript_85296/g.246590 Transcript_85296/m.246590 type:complete len:332 (+) Transcript_85296:603-1598(+)
MPRRQNDPLYCPLSCPHRLLLALPAPAFLHGLRQCRRELAQRLHQHRRPLPTLLHRTAVRHRQCASRWRRRGNRTQPQHGCVLIVASGEVRRPNDALNWHSVGLARRIHVHRAKHGDLSAPDEDQALDDLALLQDRVTCCQRAFLQAVRNSRDILRAQQPLLKTGLNTRELPQVLHSVRDELSVQCACEALVVSPGHNQQLRRLGGLHRGAALGVGEEGELTEADAALQANDRLIRAIRGVRRRDLHNDAAREDDVALVADLVHPKDVLLRRQLLDHHGPAQRSHLGLRNLGEDLDLPYEGDDGVHLLLRALMRRHLASFPNGLKAAAVHL